MWIYGSNTHSWTLFSPRLYVSFSWLSSYSPSYMHLCNTSYNVFEFCFCGLIKYLIKICIHMYWSWNIYSLTIESILYHQMRACWMCLLMFSSVSKETSRVISCHSVGGAPRKPKLQNEIDVKLSQRPPVCITIFPVFFISGIVYI